MIGRIVWTVALVAVGALTVSLQLDRQAFIDPSLAPFVPPPLRSYAQVPLAASALVGNDPAAALAEAKTLVRRRPMPSTHLTILALAQAKAGDTEAATFAIEAAATRGWRDPVAQEAALRLALANGDKAEAARRYAALFRDQATRDELLIALAPQVLGEPRGAGQEIFAGVIVAAPSWHEQFLRRGAQVLPPAAFTEIATLALERRAELPCDALARAAEILRQRDAAEAARLTGSAARRCS